MTDTKALLSLHPPQIDKLMFSYPHIDGLVVELIRDQTEASTVQCMAVCVKNTGAPFPFRFEDRKNSGLFQLPLSLRTDAVDARGGLSNRISTHL